MTVNVQPPFPCYRCKTLHQCFTPRQLCPACRAINGRRTCDRAPYDVALLEMIAKYGEEKAKAADYVCWGSQKTDPELIAINKEMYSRMREILREQESVLLAEVAA